MDVGSGGDGGTDGGRLEAGAEAAAILKMQARARRTWTADLDIWTPAKRPRPTPAESTVSPARPSGGRLARSLKTPVWMWISMLLQC